MIEVEKKFLPDQKQLKQLLAGAQKISQKLLEDIYYDTPNFTLTTKDIWLRKRNGNFELKIPTTKLGRAGPHVDQYRELTKQNEISRFLKFVASQNFELSLKNNNYEPFATIRSDRSTYKKGGMTIDVDETDFGYRIVELELMAESKKQVAKAIGEIKNFAAVHGLTFSQIKSIRGKLIEYIFRNRPQHYRALLDAGVIFSDDQKNKKV